MQYSGTPPAQPPILETQAGVYTDGYMIFRGSSAMNPAIKSFSSSTSGPVAQGQRRGLQDDSGDNGSTTDNFDSPTTNDDEPPDATGSGNGTDNWGDNGSPDNGSGDTGYGDNGSGGNDSPDDGAGEGGYSVGVANGEMEPNGSICEYDACATWVSPDSPYYEGTPLIAPDAGLDAASTAGSLAVGFAAGEAVFPPGGGVVADVGVVVVEAAEAAEAAAEASLEITQEGIDNVAAHLARPELDPWVANDSMISRLQAAVNDGRAVSGADKDFFEHETLESQLMSQGMNYNDAHDTAIAQYGVSPYSLYHPDVIRALPEEFNSGWRGYWGI